MRLSHPGFARFAAPRHRTIADLANDFLEPGPQKKIQKLLKKLNVDNLRDIATWPDDIKPSSSSGHIPSDADTKAFLSKYPDTREWHFVDLPIDATSYDVTKYAAFTRDNDIVHMAAESIKIMRGQSTKFSELNALRWIVHLVGDMHQPLHIACSYVDYSGSKPKLIFKRDEILQKQLLQKSDRGGNKIVLPIGSKGKALHSYWDGDLPKMDDKFPNPVYNPPPAVPANKLVDLPAQWVGENVKFAQEAYKGLTVKGENKAHATYIDVTWNKTSYDKRCVPLIKDLSLKAASRLAFLLNSVYS